MTMNLTTITSSLEASVVSGREAEQLARSTFLEWLFTLPDCSKLSETALHVARSIHDQPCRSEALMCFGDLMRQAALPYIPSPVRRGRAVRRIVN